MKIKSLLFAALVAGMSFTAVAGETHTNNGDKLTAENVTLKAGGEAVELKFNLNRVGSADFTNIQFSLTFPEGIHPLYDEDFEAYGRPGAGVMSKAGIPYISYSSNMDVAEKYPFHTVIGANMNKKAITANPCEAFVLAVFADDDLAAGEYELKVSDLKITSYNDDAWHTMEPQVACKITVENEVSGINDLQVNNAKTYKTIENGQVIIVKGDARYNTMGQIVK